MITTSRYTPSTRIKRARRYFWVVADASLPEGCAVESYGKLLVSDGKAFVRSKCLSGRFASRRQAKKALRRISARVAGARIARILTWVYSKDISPGAICGNVAPVPFNDYRTLQSTGVHIGRRLTPNEADEADVQAARLGLKIMTLGPPGASFRFSYMVFGSNWRVWIPGGDELAAFLAQFGQRREISA